MTPLALRARAVLFDMDGTLVDSTAVVETLWSGFARDHGLDPAHILAFSHGRPALDTVRRFLPGLADEERVAIADRLVAAELERSDGIEEVPGAASLLRRLRADVVPFALVTSAPPSLAESRMRAAGVPMPDTVVTSDDIEHGKPDPEPYLLAARMLGVSAQDCVAFEDAEAGLLSARAAGARVVVVGSHSSPASEGLERVADLTGVTIEYQ